MRLVFINSIAEVGGAERSLLAWMKAVQIAYPAATLVLVLPSEGTLANRAREIGATVAFVRMPQAIATMGGGALRGSGPVAALRLLMLFFAALPGAVYYFVRLRHKLRQLRPALIHSNSIKSHLLLRLARPRGVRVVWHIHDFIGQRPRMASALRWASSSAAMGVPVSHAVGVDARLVAPNVPMQVVYNVTDIRASATLHSPTISSSGTLLDELAGLTPSALGTVRVVLVATYARWKGQDIFLAAAASALQRMPPQTHLRFFIVGGPIYRTGGSQFSLEELRTLAQKAGLNNSIGFIPFQQDPERIYRAADIVVHASTQPEPFGLTVIEAMACGRAVIAVNAGGSGELFTDGRDALGIPLNDPKALTDAILKFAGDAELRRRFGELARDSVSRRFNPDKLPEQTRTVYKTLLHSDGESKT